MGGNAMCCGTDRNGEKNLNASIVKRPWKKVMGSTPPGKVDAADL